VIIDSNIIIYSAQAQYAFLRRFVFDTIPAVSAISFVEVLGFHKLTPADRGFFEDFFSGAEMFPLSQLVLDLAVSLRQQRKIGLGDSIVAATALIHHHDLVTRNTADFDWIPGLKLINPFAPPAA
jgi:predicted nucleic acid-binding protein